MNNITQTLIPTIPIITTVTPNRSNKKKIIAIIFLTVLGIGTIAGIFLIMRPILYKTQAWDCGKYTFSLSDAGIVSVTNDSNNSESLQSANLYINNSLIQTFNVPALPAKSSTVTLGTVQVPSSNYTWQIQGTSSCTNSGAYTSGVTFQCQAIKIYDQSNTEITTSSLSKLEAGDNIKLAVVGSGSQNDYSAVRFTINGQLQSESTSRLPTSNYLSQDYTIPSSVKSFNFSAELKAVADGNWY